MQEETQESTQGSNSNPFAPQQIQKLLNLL